MLALGVFMAACAASQAAEPLPTATLPVVPTATPSASTAAAATVTTTATASPTNTLEPTPTSTPELLISEVLPATQPPRAPSAQAPVRGGAHLPVPEGTTVVRGACSSDGECHWYNFYWAPTHEVVVQNGEGQHKVQHELCHAHQHWSINGGAPLAPSDYDLESWYVAAEGQSFTAAVAGLPWPWSHSAVSGLEDFAWTCAYWYLDPAYLLEVSPERHGWAEQNLP